MPSGRRIFACFCSERGHKPQNFGCVYTAQRFHTARVNSRRRPPRRRRQVFPGKRPSRRPAVISAVGHNRPPALQKRWEDLGLKARRQESNGRGRTGPSLPVGRPQVGYCIAREAVSGEPPAVSSGSPQSDTTSSARSSIGTCSRPSSESEQWLSQRPGRRNSTYCPVHISGTALDERDSSDVASKDSEENVCTGE